MCECKKVNCYVTAKAEPLHVLLYITDLLQLFEAHI